MPDADCMFLSGDEGFVWFIIAQVRNMQHSLIQINQEEHQCEQNMLTLMVEEHSV